MRCAALLWDPEQMEHRTSPDGQLPTGGIDIHWLARMRRIAPPRSRAELRVPCKKHRVVPQDGRSRSRDTPACWLRPRRRLAFLVIRWGVVKDLNDLTRGILLLYDDV